MSCSTFYFTVQFVSQHLHFRQESIFVALHLCAKSSEMLLLKANTGVRKVQNKIQNGLTDTNPEKGIAAEQKLIVSRRIIIRVRHCVITA